MKRLKKEPSHYTFVKVYKSVCEYVCVCVRVCGSPPQPAVRGAGSTM